MRRLSSINFPYLSLVFALVAFGCSRVLDDDDDKVFQRALFEPPGSGAPFLESPQVIAGYAETCALLTDGSVKCWGWNNYGTLGIGNTGTVGDDPGEMGEALEAVNLGGRARQIDMFGSHVCALLEDESVKCWGRGSYGSLGQGSSDSFGDDPGEMGDALAPVDLGTGLSALQIGAGSAHSCALLDGGSLKCWGRLGNTDFIGNSPGEMGDALAPVDLGTNRTVEAFDAGYSRTCAILDGGDLKCWGSGNFGALGYGSGTTLGDDPGEMGDNLDPVDLGTNRSAVSVAGGFFHVVGGRP